jgi:hypothetical protein
MTIIIGELRPAGLAGYNQNLSSDLDGYAWVPAPHESIGAIGPGDGVLISALPVTVAPQQLSGERLGCWGDDWYHRIHISLQRLDLGNVASTQTAPVRVWNAHLLPRSLQAIAGLDDGIELAGQPLPPLLFAALQEREWQLSITPDGAPVLDVSLSWQFDNGEAPAIRITATRIIAWAFAPNWADGITERLDWATDVLQSETGMEQRRALRQAPRREFEISLLAEGRERQLLDLSVFGWGSRVWALPIWPDIQLTGVSVPAGALAIPCSTAGRDFRAGGLALLRSESAFGVEVVEVLSVELDGLTLKRSTQQDWPAGSRLYPARPATLAEQPGSDRLTDRLDRVNCRFQVLDACDWPDVMPATLYRGVPVLTARPDESEDLTRAYQRLLLELDNGTALPLLTDTASRAFPVMQHRWLLSGRDEQAAFRSLLYALSGRLAAVWVPTHADDLELVAPVSDVAMSVDVAAIGYTRFGRSQPGRRDVRIELVDGTALHRRITSSSELSADVERLVLDSALGRNVAPGDVLRISWLVLCRLDSDGIEIEHMTDSDGLARSHVVFRGVRDEEFSA